MLTQAKINTYRRGAEPRRLDQQELNALNRDNEVNGQDGQNDLVSRVQRYFGTMTKEFIREQEHRSGTYQNPDTTQADINAYRQEMEPRRNTDSQRFNDQSRRSEVDRQEDFAMQRGQYLDSMRANFIREAQRERNYERNDLNNRWHALINDRGTFDENTSKNIHNAQQATFYLNIQKEAYLSRREEFKADWRSRRDQQLNRLERLRNAETERRAKRDQRYGEHAQPPVERMIIE